mgnify:CR=1 FL=1
MQTTAAEYPDVKDIIFENETELTERCSIFIVDTQEKATWAAHKILNAESRIQERSELARTYKAKIDDWLSEANKADEKSIAALSSLLYPYLSSVLSGESKKRSIELLGTRLGFRKIPEKVEIVDEEKALSYCEKNHPDTVIVKKELSRQELKKLVLKGILIPGVVLDGGISRLYVNPLEIA